MRNKQTVFLLSLLLVLSFLVSPAFGQTNREKAAEASRTAAKWLLSPSSSTLQAQNAIQAVYLVKNQKTGKQATGFLLKNGPLITNETLVRGCSGPDILALSCTAEEITFRPEIKTDPERNLAALFPTVRISAPGLFISNDPHFIAGNALSTWGYPAGYNNPPPVLCMGVFSGFQAYPKKDRLNEYVKHLLFSGNFDSGNCGGPLFEFYGDRVIGVIIPQTTAVGSKVLTGEAISLDDLRGFLKENNIPETTF